MRYCGGGVGHLAPETRCRPETAAEASDLPEHTHSSILDDEDEPRVDRSSMDGCSGHEAEAVAGDSEESGSESDSDKENSEEQGLRKLVM